MERKHGPPTQTCMWCDATMRRGEIIDHEESCIRIAYGFARKAVNDEAMVIIERLRAERERRGQERTDRTATE